MDFCAVRNEPVDAGSFLEDAHRRLRCAVRLGLLQGTYCLEAALRLRSRFPSRHQAALDRRLPPAFLRLDLVYLRRGDVTHELVAGRDSSPPRHAARTSAAGCPGLRSGGDRAVRTGRSPLRPLRSPVATRTGRLQRSARTPARPARSVESPMLDFPPEPVGLWMLPSRPTVTCAFAPGPTSGMPSTA